LSDEESRRDLYLRTQAQVKSRN